MVRLRTRRARRDGGSAAVEFALVVPVLLTLVFGIIDFGIFFSDSLAVRSGVREGARQAVVGECGGDPFSGLCVASFTKGRIDPIAAGAQYVKVVTPAGTTKGADLVVCAVVQVAGVTGITPLPDGSTTRAKVTMRIEHDLPSDPSYDNDGTPPGGWDFCS